MTKIIRHSMDKGVEIIDTNQPQEKLSPNLLKEKTTQDFIKKIELFTEVINGKRKQKISIELELYYLTVLHLSTIYYCDDIKNFDNKIDKGGRRKENEIERAMEIFFDDYYIRNEIAPTNRELLKILKDDFLTPVNLIITERNKEKKEKNSSVKDEDLLKLKKISPKHVGNFIKKRCEKFNLKRGKN